MKLKFTIHSLWFSFSISFLFHITILFLYFIFFSSHFFIDSSKVHLQQMKAKQIAKLFFLENQTSSISQSIQIQKINENSNLESSLPKASLKTYLKIKVQKQVPLKKENSKTQPSKVKLHPLKKTQEVVQKNKKNILQKNNIKNKNTQNKNIQNKTSFIESNQFLSTGTQNQVPSSYQLKIHQIALKIQEYLSQINVEKYYPIRARQRGIQGTATVQFDFLSQKNSASIALFKTSTSSLIDQAALKLIKHHKVEIEKTILSFSENKVYKNKTYSILIPVTFSLN